MKETSNIGDLKIGGRVTNKARLIIAKTQKELKDIINGLVVTGRKHGKRIGIDMSQVMREYRM